MKDLKVHRVGEIVSGLMERINELFVPGSKITVIVRQPGYPDRDFVMTDDDLAEAVSALERREKEGPTR